MTLRFEPTVAAHFYALWEARDKRYLGAHGGRGSGKSWDRALHAVTRMANEHDFRIACVREVQKSLKDSVHQLLVDTIKREGLEQKFEITERAIRAHPTGAYAIFMGMKDQSSEGVKSLEGMDVAWIEEAQNLSNRSLEVLRPTIRKQRSQIWATWNPRFRHDPIDRLLRQNDVVAKEAKVIRVNWDSNPWFTAELEAERQMDLHAFPERYPHVWDGEYETESDFQFITGALVQACREVEPYSEIDDPCIMGVDVARFGDDTSIIKCRRGRDARTMPTHRYRKLSTMQLVGKITEKMKRYKVDQVFIDETGVGGGVVDRLLQMGYENVLGVNFGKTSDHHIQGTAKANNKRSEMWVNMRAAMASGLAIEDDDEWEMDLTGPLYQFDKDNRVQLEKKDDMKKRGVRSPDHADALALTYAYPVVAHAIRQAEIEREIEEYHPYA